MIYALTAVFIIVGAAVAIAICAIDPIELRDDK